jgi:hypothetical protein
MCFGTAAMELLDAGVDSTVISLGLSHESTGSTQPHLHAHLESKEAALAKIGPFNDKPYLPALQSRRQASIVPRQTLTAIYLVMPRKPRHHNSPGGLVTLIHDLNNGMVACRPEADVAMRLG